MEPSFLHAKTLALLSAVPMTITRPSSVRQPNTCNPYRRLKVEGQPAKCGSTLNRERLGVEVAQGSISSGELGGDAEVQANPEEEEEEEEWLKQLGRSTEKCKGGGAVEVLECLEREAIMGEDAGKEPSDYNRRAQIFDKSSRVFLALKERTFSLHQSG